MIIFHRKSTQQGKFIIQISVCSFGFSNLSLYFTFFFSRENDLKKKYEFISKIKPMESILCLPT